MLVLIALMLLLLLVLLILVVSVMVERDAVELLKRIDEFVARRCEPRVERHALDPRRADVDALALLDVSEVRRLEPASLVRDDRGLHVSQQGPLGRAEERMAFDVRCACTRPESTALVLDQKFSDEGLAQAMVGRVSLGRRRTGQDSHKRGHTWISVAPRDALRTAPHHGGSLQRWRCGSSP